MMMSYKKKEEDEGRQPEEIAMVPKPGWGSKGKLDDDDTDSQCGLGSCTPSFLQRFKTMWTFTFCVALSSVGAEFLHFYLKTQDTALQRQFEITPANTNWMFYSSEVAFIFSVLFLSIFARRVHIPRFLAISSLVCGFAGFLCVFPFFITKGDLLPPVKVFENQTFTIERIQMKAPSCIVNKEAIAVVQRLMMEEAARSSAQVKPPVHSRLMAKTQMVNPPPAAVPSTMKKTTTTTPSRMLTATSTIPTASANGNDPATPEAIIAKTSIPDENENSVTENSIASSSTELAKRFKIISIPDYKKLMTHENFNFFNKMSSMMGIDLAELANLTVEEQAERSMNLPPALKAMLPNMKEMLGPNPDYYFQNVTVEVPPESERRRRRSAPSKGRVDLTTDLAYTGQLVKMMKATGPLPPSIMLKAFKELCPFNTGPFMTNTSTGVLKIFNVAMIMQGIARAPRFAFAISFINDNTNGRNTVLHLGILFGITYLGPFVSILFGFLVNNFYITFEDVGAMTFINPRWLPAWWLGFLAMAAYTLSSLCLLFFPRSLRQSGQLTVADSTSETFCFSISGYISELLSSLMRLCTNLVYMCLLVGDLLNCFATAGLTVVLATYVTNQFQLAPFVPGFILVFVVILVFNTGVFLGGIMSSRFKCSPLGNLKLALGLAAAIVVLQTLQLGVGCTQPDLDKGARVIGNKSSELCSSICPCSEMLISPGCGSDGRTYYSPCHAGCGEGYDGKFHDCKCIDDNERTLTPGYCPDCDFFYPFCIIICVASIVFGIQYVPLFVATFRSVNVKDIPMAIGLKAMLMVAFVGIPSPIVYNRIVSAQCIHRHPECGIYDTCGLYDIEDHRYHIFGLSVGLHLIGALLYSVAYWFGRKSSIYHEQVLTKEPVKA